MPLFRIHCSESRSRWLTVEAADLQAVSRYYDGIDDELELFHGEDDLHWELDEIEPLTKPDGPVDVVVREDLSE